MAQSVEVVVSELDSAAARLDGAAQRLKDGLSSVDDETAQLIGADWKGGAASAYAPAWEKWHDGAKQVVTGLQRMSELLTIAGKEYAKTDESAAGALHSTMQGSGGSTGGGGGSASGSSVDPSASQGTGGASRAVTASQAAGSTEGMQQAMQLGQVANQPLSQVGQVATGLAQAMTGLAQQVTELATAAAEHAGEESAEGNAEDATPGESSMGTAPTDSSPTDRGRAVERPGE